MTGLNLPRYSISALLDLPVELALNRVIDMGVSSSLMELVTGHHLNFDRRRGLWRLSTRFREEESHPDALFEQAVNERMRLRDIGAEKRGSHLVFELYPGEDILRAEEHATHVAYKWRAESRDLNPLSLMTRLFQVFGMDAGVLQACVDGSVEEWDAELPLSVADLRHGEWTAASWIRLNGRRFDLYADLKLRADGSAYMGLIGERQPNRSRQDARDAVDAAFMLLFAQTNLLGLPATVASDFLDAKRRHPLSAEGSAHYSLGGTVGPNTSSP